jgi:hypothetical protein
MNKIVSFGILAASIAIIIIGFTMSNSIKSTVYPYTAGGGTSIGTLLMLGLGFVGIIVGIFVIIRGPKLEE